MKRIGFILSAVCVAIGTMTGVSYIFSNYGLLGGIMVTLLIVLGTIGLGRCLFLWYVCSSIDKREKRIKIYLDECDEKLQREK